MALRIRKALMTASVVALLVCTCFVWGGRAQAASAAPFDLASLQQNCAVVGVHLHGALHTVTCLQPRTASSLSHANARMVPQIGTRPNTGFTSCYGSYKMSVRDAQGTIYCFGGSGYLGLSPNIIDPVNISDWGYPEWVRVYDSTYFAGHFCNLTDYQLLADFGYIFAYKLTQVYLGGTHSGSDPWCSGYTFGS